MRVIIFFELVKLDLSRRISTNFLNSSFSILCLTRNEIQQTLDLPDVDRIEDRFRLISSRYRNLAVCKSSMSVECCVLGDIYMLFRKGKWLSLW